MIYSYMIPRILILPKKPSLSCMLFGWLFGFYGISTLVGHSTPNSVYIYIHTYSTIDFKTNIMVGRMFY